MKQNPSSETEYLKEEKETRWPVDTPGGRYYAEFETQTPTTREGQLIFFAQFLQTGGIWERFVKNCPLKYQSNRGSKVIDILGTLTMSILCGHWRYAHISAVRGDKLNPQLLGMNQTVSEDAARRAIRRIEEVEGLAWLHGELRACLEPILIYPWILDIDVTTKSIYGHQEGAAIGYNAHKPGRPSHNYHSYFMANTRLCLGVDVLDGKKTAGKYGLSGLWRILDALLRAQWPAMIRGDCNYGNEYIIKEAEERDLPYLFRLRHSLKVKTFVNAMQYAGAKWKNTGDGWEVLEASLKLSGWTQERRIILVRPAIAPISKDAPCGKELLLPTAHLWDKTSAPWGGRVAVLVTSLQPKTYPAESLAQLYRERADAENIYDELKNQWGWNGFTTKQLTPCKIMANLIALIYNWWNLYARLYDADHHREAITSTPTLLGGVARIIRHSAQYVVKISLQHENGHLLEKFIPQISNSLNRLLKMAQQWNYQERWTFLVTHTFRRFLGGKWLVPTSQEIFALPSG